MVCCNSIAGMIQASLSTGLAFAAAGNASSIRNLKQRSILALVSEKEADLVRVAPVVATSNRVVLHGDPARRPNCMYQLLSLRSYFAVVSISESRVMT